MRIHRDGSATVVSARGELDAFSAPELSAALEDVRADVAVVVDLGRVSFMDSTALGLLFRGVKDLGARGGRVRVVLPETSARRIFEITTLDRVLPLSPSRADALAAVLAAD